MGECLTVEALAVSKIDWILQCEVFLFTFPALLVPCQAYQSCLGPESTEEQTEENQAGVHGEYAGRLLLL